MDSPQNENAMDNGGGMDQQYEREEEMANTLRCCYINDGEDMKSLKDLIDVLEHSYEIPGDYLHEKEIFLYGLIKKFPKELAGLEINIQDSTFIWKIDEEIEEEEPKSNSPKDDVNAKNDLYVYILNHLDAMKDLQFHKDQVVQDIMKETGESYCNINHELLHVLAKKLQPYFQRELLGDKWYKRIGPPEVVEPCFNGSLFHKIVYHGIPKFDAVKISYTSFGEFAVCPIKYANELVAMNYVIQRTMEKNKNSIADAPPKGWKCGYGCFCKINENDSDRWYRGLIVSMDEKKYDVHLIDEGYSVLMDPTDLKVMPRMYRTLASHVLMCTLHADEGTINAADKLLGETFENSSSPIGIYIVQVPSNAFTPFRVKIFKTDYGESETITDTTVALL